jgi:hypothetical protein
VFPRDVLCLLLQHFIPSPRGYLIPRPLARSYYQICRDECIRDRYEEPRQAILRLSIDYYQRLPNNKSSYPATDLVSIAPRVLRFLEKVRELNIASYSALQLERLFDDYVWFLLLWKLYSARGDSGRTIPLVPTLAIQAIWFSHMLQSHDYYLFVYRQIQPVREIVGMQDNSNDFSHPLWLDPEVYAKQEEMTITFMKKHYGSALDALPPTQEFIAMKKLILASFTPAMLVNDQDWLTEFECFTHGTDVFSKEFLQKAHLGMPL